MRRNWEGQKRWRIHWVIELEQRLKTRRKMMQRWRVRQVLVPLVGRQIEKEQWLSGLKRQMLER